MERRERGVREEGGGREKRKSEKWEEKGESAHPLVHSTNICDSWRYAMPKMGT